jgi:hypothetical protein
MAIVEPGLFCVTSASSAPPLLVLARRLGVDIQLHDLPPSDETRVDVAGQDAEEGGVLYRFGQRWVLLLAMNDDGPAAEAWTRMSDRWFEVAPAESAVARFGITTEEPQEAHQVVSWGWVRGTLHELEALCRPDAELEANVSICQWWPFAWEIARQGRSAVQAGDDAASLLRAASSAGSELVSCSEALLDHSSNVGRMMHGDESGFVKVLMRQSLPGWTRARKGWHHESAAGGGSHRVVAFPYPVAAAQRSIRRSWPALRRFEKVLDAAEAAVAVAALLAADQLRHAGGDIRHSAWCKPAFSVWPKLGREFCEQLPKKARTPLFSPETWSAIGAAFEPLVTIRNQVHGHGPTHVLDSYYDELLDEVEGGLDAVLDLLAPLRGVRLARILHRESRRGHVPSARVELLVGSNASFEHAIVSPCPSDIYDDDVVLITPDEDVRSLHPFFAMIDAGGWQTVGCLSGLRGGQGRYLCRASGASAQLPLEAGELSKPVDCPAGRVG